MASTKISALDVLTGANVADDDALALVDTSAGATKRITPLEFRDGYLRTGLRNITATTAPGVSNDDSEGYQVGSFWFDVTEDKAYACKDASTGAAVWDELAGGAAAASPLTTKGDIWVYGSADTRLPIGSDGQILVADSSDDEGMVWRGETVNLAYALSDEATALTTGTKLVMQGPPFAWTLTAVDGFVTTAATGATLLELDLEEGGSTVFSTRPTFDASEQATATAATPAVISDSAIASRAVLTFKVVAVGNTVAGAGLKMQLTGTKP